MARTRKTKDTNTVFIEGKTWIVADVVEKLTRVVSKSFLIKDIYERWTNETMVPDGYLQRMEGQWVKKQNSRLIYAILENRPIGTVIIATGRTYDNDYTVYSILDGLQRTTAIVNFINNKFKLDKKEKPIVCRLRDEDGNIEEKIFEIAGKDFKSLPKVLQNKFLDYSVRVDSYEGFSDEELDDIMFCVNNGKSPTTYQKMRFALGTDNMRLLQPICESLTWEEVSGCNSKNDTTLGSVLRGLMIYCNCVNGGLSPNGINKFIEDFDDNVSADILIKFTNTVEAFDDIKFKMTDEERKLLDSCNIPHFIANFDIYNSLENKSGKTYLDFFRAFIQSKDWTKFTSYKAKKITAQTEKKETSDEIAMTAEKGEKSGSGGTQYSAESVNERQYIIDEFLYDFLGCSIPYNGAVIRNRTIKDEINEEDNSNDEGKQENAAVNSSEATEYAYRDIETENYSETWIYNTDLCRDTGSCGSTGERGFEDKKEYQQEGIVSSDGEQIRAAVSFDPRHNDVYECVQTG